VLFVLTAADQGSSGMPSLIGYGVECVRCRLISKTELLSV
jgi:hypothetical protein